ncbi:50S ribosomal protein L21 [Gulosibacter molinativorax]|nr:50S ribosomal protein L21 [Gulosibacter molinativorax]
MLFSPVLRRINPLWTTVQSTEKKVAEVVFAVVRAGGRQEKVEVGSVVTMNRVVADDKGNVNLPAVLLVDGDKITSDADKLAKVTVTAEVVEDLRGPKIRIQKYKNKTGYKKRQGHRQELTTVKITDIK